MPDSGFLGLSVASVALGALLFLSPKSVLRFSEVLNRTLAVLDAQVVRYRYVVGLLAFVASYAFFKLALLLPSLKG